MGRPKIGQTFEFAKNFDSMTKFEKYCNKKQFSFRWPKSEKKPNCKVCKRAGTIKASKNSKQCKVKRLIKKEYTP